MRKLRIEKNLTPTEMASMLGFKSHVSIIRMEEGLQTFPSKIIYLLCCIFNVTPNEFFPPVKNAAVVKQQKEVIVKPKIFKVKGLPKI